MFEIFFFRNAKGDCPVLSRLDDLPPKIMAKAWVRIEELEEHGNNLTRPKSDHLRDGIYELRFRDIKVQYRILYFFLNKGVIILSSLITKEKKVPPKEIDKCIANKKLVDSNFELYTYSEPEENEQEP